MKLLTRDEFREAVFIRDGHRCVVCGAEAQDAHHVMERRLFDDGGYYLNNGASLCGPHHLEAEDTTLSVERILACINVATRVTPPHLYRDQVYDKWGNPVLANGQRLPGELFGDASVRKILGESLRLFGHHVKYPRTYHLPWSPGATEDDRILPSLDAFKDVEVVITEKMDGENTSLYRDYYHARSLDSNSHPSQSWARQRHAQVAYNIPEGWRVCAENLYAKHSIAYDSLPDYLLTFSVWDEMNRCLGWDDTVEWSELIGLKTVPVIYRGPWDEKLTRNLKPAGEGYVVRVSRAFGYGEFRRVVGKFVRSGHVQTTHHWKAQAVVPNVLALEPKPAASP